MILIMHISRLEPDQPIHVPSFKWTNITRKEKQQTYHECFLIAWYTRLEGTVYPLYETILIIYFDNNRENKFMQSTY